MKLKLARLALITGALAFTFAATPALAQHGEGDYDPHHTWRASSWWEKHDPGWVSEHHPEWIQAHPDWAGDYDENHHWHARSWWTKHKPDWVKEHHPDWH
jgi:hypothetical protein